MREKQAMTSNTERRLSMYRTGKNYYPQVFLEECEYAAKEKVCMSMLLVTDISSVEENSDYSCEENSNEKYPDEESKFE